MAVPDLTAWKLEDPERGRRILSTLLDAFSPPETATLISLLARHVPPSPDPDRALNNLERFFQNRLAREQFPTLAENDGRGLEELLHLFGTSQFFSDILVRDPDFLEVVRLPLRNTPTREELIQQLSAETAIVTDDGAVLRAVRKFRQRQHLRIGINDILRDRPLEEITADLSRVADACIEVAFQVALRTMYHRMGTPVSSQEGSARGVVLAFGKLGGEELNYSSDIDLMVIYDEEGEVRGSRGSYSNEEFFGRAAQEMIRLLSAHTDRGQAYRVDFRLRPEGSRGPLARSLLSTLSYYDTLGRTWERQALIKVRPVAGDRALGEEFLRSVEPFVYRKYLSFAEIHEIKAMKRRIEQRTKQVGDHERDVKTGRGGIRDVEFTIQFLQLLNGGDLPQLRRCSTLDAMQSLASVGCLTDPEYRVLDDAYRFLRKTEHHLQILFDLATHRLPEGAKELRKLALRMGYPDRRVVKPSDPEEAPIARTVLSAQKHSPLDEPPITPSLDTRDLLHDPLDRFLHDYQEKSHRTRTILDHLLHQAFPDSEEHAEPETDLILAPEADEQTIREVLGRYPFRDVLGAYRNLSQLAQEAGPFLSTRRCRHFLAAIAPALLRAVVETPDPDLTLIQLEKVSSSLGAKAVLWELFSFNPPSLRLYVDLCSNSPFLSQILINNPGMIDDLLDSLILNRPRTADELRTELKELFRGVDRPEVIEPILHSFQDKELLRLGVRDLLGMDTIRETTAELSNLAEVLLGEIAQREESVMRVRYGAPRLREGGDTRWVILAMGKLGGREMSYQSDLDLVLIYEGDGETDSATTSIDNFHYFTELARSIIKTTGQTGPMGRLYEVDMRLRPTGKSGNLVVPLEEFQRYYDGAAQIWERQSLTRGRIVFGESRFAEQVMLRVQHAIHAVPWSTAITEEIRTMRRRLEESASLRSLKRSRGGLIDVEFLVQFLLLKHGSTQPSLAKTNTWDALDAFRDAGILTVQDHDILTNAYSFLRKAEARLRIVTNRPLNEYPETEDALEKYARRLGFEPSVVSAAEQFRTSMRRITTEVREVFERITSIS